jgi:hypothetical protein
MPIEEEIIKSGEPEHYNNKTKPKRTNTCWTAQVAGTELALEHGHPNKCWTPLRLLHHRGHRDKNAKQRACFVEADKTKIQC